LVIAHPPRRRRLPTYAHGAKIVTNLIFIVFLALPATFSVAAQAFIHPSNGILLGVSMA